MQQAAVVMVFSGQGAQWAGMGKELTQLGASVMEDVKRMDSALKKVKRPPSWTIKGTPCFVQKLGIRLTLPQRNSRATRTPPLAELTLLNSRSL
jgi:malonyl CoA-acyl carrier protein transacylase